MTLGMTTSEQAAVAVNPALAKRHEEDGQTLVGQAEALQVTSRETFEAAGEVLKAIKAYLAEVGKLLDPVIAATNTAHKAALAQKKTLTEDALKAEITLKQRMATFRNQERAAALAAQAKKVLAAQAAARQAGTAPVALVPPAAAAPKAEGVTFTERWDYEVTDLSLVPREYLMIDDKKVGAVVKAMKAETPIPGIRVFPVDSVRVTA